MGPILFVLFINDLPEGLSTGTDLALYADDTKIWRTINGDEDHYQLQKDIEYLKDWASNNKMRFHPGKCKVLSVSLKEPPLLGILPNIEFFYSLGNVFLDYVLSEKDLGVDITPKLNWETQCDRLVSKASQQLGILRRTCYFLNNASKCRSLYIALVRSQFHDCSIIWRPTSQSYISKIERIQKRAIKWVLAEENISYSPYSVYIRKCRQVNLLLMSSLFDLFDLLFLHKVIYNLTPVSLPKYLTLFQGHSRLRSCHLDSLSLVSSISPQTSTNRNILYKSYFYRTHLLWNRLPYKIREFKGHIAFKQALVKHLWTDILADNAQDESQPIEDGVILDNG